MWLIATDEAGYGPKLGPFVIVATAWRVEAPAFPDREMLQACFAPLRKKVRCGDRSFRVEDSKAAFQPSGRDPRGKLHALVSSGLRWCGIGSPSVQELLPLIAPDDLEDVAQEPWFDRLVDLPFLGPTLTDPIVAEWGSCGVSQRDVQVRVITPRRFNASCRDGRNKADLLTESTLGLVRRLIDRNVAGSSFVDVFCDRHGGRRYYGGGVQHAFPETPVAVEREHPAESTYRFGTSQTEGRIRFTVKGDTFAPVAMSSLFAKYLRECFMSSLNAYFAELYLGDETLRPTAGYPGDAERFIQQVREVCRGQSIADGDWIRCR